jgi:hypothetical protein
VERIPLNSRGTRNGIPSHDFQCHRQEVMMNGGTNANEVRFLCALSIPEQYLANGGTREELYAPPGRRPVQ